MTTLDESTLIAYVDGELDGETAREVEAQISHDATARKFVERLREIEALARVAFNDTLHEEVPEHLLATVLDSAAPKPRGANIVAFAAPKMAAVSRHLGLPMAAALAGLIIGGGGGFGFGEVNTQRALQQAALAEQQDSIAMQSVLNQALEVNLSGTGQGWVNPDTQRQAQFTPVRTYQDPSGRYCREYKKDLTENGTTTSTYGLACRQDDGQWKTRYLILDGEGPSL